MNTKFTSFLTLPLVLNSSLIEDVVSFSRHVYFVKGFRIVTRRFQTNRLSVTLKANIFLKMKWNFVFEPFAKCQP